MADSKIPDLPVLTAVASGDLLSIVDVSDATDDAAGSSKKITQANLVGAFANTFTVGQTIAPTAVASGSPTALTVTAAAHTGLTASTENIGVNLNMSATKQFATGALTTQREVVIQGPTYAFVGASTITNATTLYVKEPTAGTNATITRKSAVVAEGTVTVRQPGGTAGTDEIQISHDGTGGLLNCKDGAMTITNGFGQSMTLGVGGVSFYGAISQGTTWYFSGSRWVTSPSGSYTFSASGNAVSADEDSGIYRVAAKVTGPFSPSGTLGWFQNVGGVSRVSSNVTNVTTTLAAITGLSSTLIAGRKYSGKLIIYCDEATAADGLKLDFDSGTATMTSFIAQGVLSDDTSVRKVARTTAIATDITEATITGSTMVEINFSLVCNAGGTFIPRQAKNSDGSGGGTMTVTIGTCMMIEDIP